MPLEEMPVHNTLHIPMQFTIPKASFVRLRAHNNIILSAVQVGVKKGGVPTLVQ